MFGQQIWVGRKKHGNPYSSPYSFTHVTITARARKIVIIIIASINRTQVVTKQQKRCKNRFCRSQDTYTEKERQSQVQTLVIQNLENYRILL